MEQSDLAEFHYYEDNEEGKGYLSHTECEPLVKTYEIPLGSSPNLLELMEDAAAHFAQVHRKSNEY